MIFGIWKEADKDYRSKWMQIFRHYATNWSACDIDCGMHPEWEIMYIAHGKCRVTCSPREEELVYDLKSGEYILFMGGLKHRLYGDKDTSCQILNVEGRVTEAQSSFSFQMLETDKSTVAFLQNPAPVLVGHDEGRLYEVLKSMITELDENRCDVTGHNTPMLNILLGELILVLGKQSVCKQKLQRGQLVYVRKTREYLEKYFDEDLTVSKVAEYVGISEGYLQRLYKKERGYSVVEEIQRLRVEKAKLLLEKTSLPMIDVAVNVGFGSRQHFTATFKKRTGYTPAEWRKKRYLI